MSQIEQASSDQSRATLQATAYQPPLHAETRPGLSWRHLLSLRHRLSLRRLLSLRRMGLLSLVAILALFVVFLLFARSIQVTVQTASDSADEPAQIVDATVSLNAWLKLPIGNRYLVLPGRFGIQVQAPGFVTQQLVVEVAEQRFQQFPVLLEKLPGILDVSVRALEVLSHQAPQDQALPDRDIAIIGAELSLGDTLKGAVPGLLTGVPAGWHTVSVDAPLYRKATQEVSVLGKAQTQAIEFVLEPAWAHYQFNADQADVVLSVDGDPVGKLPLRLPLEEGAHEVSYSKPLFQTHTKTIIVSANQDVVVAPVVLRSAPGVLKLSSKPSGAAVLIDDEFKGQTPIELSLDSHQTHRVQLYRPGFKVAEQSLESQPAQTKELAINLQADTVPVTLSLSPANAQVSVNGKSVGSGLRTLNLSTVAQTITVSAPGYVSETKSIVPIRSTQAEGATQIVSFELLTREQSYWANIPDSYSNSVGNEMRLFKAPGLVAMGSGRRELGRRSNEVAYQAKLSKAFYVSTLETSNAQFREYDSAHTSGNYKRKSLDLNNYPAVNLSWQQAALYCNWLSKREQLEPFYTTQSGFVSGHNESANGYRLLSEAEWTWLVSLERTKSERAKSESIKRDTGAQAVGSQEADTAIASIEAWVYPWGNSERPPEKQRFANVADEQAKNLINFILEDYDDGYVTAAPVGSFDSDRRGLFDLDGNVAEWTHDWYSAQGNKPQADAAPDGIALDPLGSEIGEYHVIKGPSWARGYLPQLRLAYRDSGAVGRHDVGFRVARYAHQ